MFVKVRNRSCFVKFSYTECYALDKKLCTFTTSFVLINKFVLIIRSCVLIVESCVLTMNKSLIR